jgi:hypothetical protein
MGSSRGWLACRRRLLLAEACNTECRFVVVLLLLLLLL